MARSKSECLGGSVADREVRDGLDAYCDGLLDSVRAGRQTYDPIVAEQCVTYLSSATCAELAHSSFPASPGENRACARVTAPAVPIGADCVGPSECGGHATCDNWSFVTGQCTRRCVPTRTVAPDEGCDIALNTCPGGWGCYLTIADVEAGIPGSCQQRGVPGEPCNDVGCVDGSFCDYYRNVCVRSDAQEGAPCGFQENGRYSCEATGLVCAGPSDGTTCTRQRKIGEACTVEGYFNNECGYEANCVSGVCALMPLIGERCFADPQAPVICAFDGKCSVEMGEGICVPTGGAQGSACAKHLDCASNRCQDGSCLPSRWECAPR